MTLNVVHDNLTAAADRIEDTVAPMESYTLPVLSLRPEVIGHQELVEWMDALKADAQQMGNELFTAMTAIAASLDETATDFSQTDDAVGTSFGMDPLTRFGLPGGFGSAPPTTNSPAPSPPAGPR